MNSTKNIILTIAIATGFVALFAIYYIFSLGSKKQSEILFEQINKEKLKITMIENELISVKEISKIKEEGYQNLTNLAVENLQKQIDFLEKKLDQRSISANSAVERRLILALSLIMDIQKDAMYGRNLSSKIDRLKTITSFDQSLYAIAKSIKDISFVRTESEITTDYIRIVRRIANAYYKANGRYVLAFFARHFYADKTNGKFYKIGVLIEQKDFSLAAKELKRAMDGIKNEDAENYISSIEDYNLLHMAIEEMQSYIVSQFSVS